MPSAAHEPGSSTPERSRSLPAAVGGALALLATLGTMPAAAGVRCEGVFALEDGSLHGRFHCRYRHAALRRVQAVCRDGEPGCDTDGRCDGTCRFALCADRRCAETFDVSVPLRRGGRARGRTAFRANHARVVLRCLPSRGPCDDAGTTTTTSTTTTTIPPRACAGALGGAAAGEFACAASLGIGGLGLPVLRISIGGPAAEGTVAILLDRAAAGSFSLGRGVILALATLDEPVRLSFTGTREQEGEHALLRIDHLAGPDAGGRFEMQGVLDATLAGTPGSAPLVLHAEF